MQQTALHVDHPTDAEPCMTDRNEAGWGNTLRRILMAASVNTGRQTVGGCGPCVLINHFCYGSFHKVRFLRMSAGQMNLGFRSRNDLCDPIIVDA